MDREKVIKEYEDYVNSYISLTTSHDYEFEMHKAVLAILKEQEAVVRCKDCKWNSATPHNPLCQKDCNAHEPYWFCADGDVKIAKNDGKIAKHEANGSIDERITPREIPLKF